MTTDIFDSDTPADVPSSAPGAAFYVDGAHPATAADFDRFYGKPVIQITRVITDTAADALDVERGAADPAGAARWVAARNKAGKRVAIVYASLDNWPPLDAALKGHAYQRWVAHWTGKSHPESGAAIVQWADAAMTGHHYDRSTIFDAALEKLLIRVKPKPKADPLTALKAAQATLAQAQADVSSAISALGG